MSQTHTTARHAAAVAPRTTSKRGPLNGRPPGPVPLHSTRLRGYHFRHYHAPDPESWEYTAWVYRGEVVIGHVVYEGEAGLLLNILPQHRASWSRLVRFIHAHPRCVDSHGNYKHYASPEENVLSILREITKAERVFNRARNLTNGILGFTWRFEHYGWWPAAVTHVSSGSPIVPAAIPANVFHLIAIGADNPSFTRAAAPPPPRQS